MLIVQKDPVLRLEHPTRVAGAGDSGARSKNKAMSATILRE